MAPPPLLVLSPVEPRRSGNGLAMRVARFAEAAASRYEVTVAVVPVAGAVPPTGTQLSFPVSIVTPPSGPVLRGRLAELLADPDWRRLLSAAEPMPPRARAASAALADDVISASGARGGTPVHAVRSYMAPLALAVAEKLDSPWSTLDLDDDDEQVARAQGDEESADACRRLVTAFSPAFASVCMASPAEARAMGARLGRAVAVVPNAVELGPPPSVPRPGSGSGELLFVGNLTYPPNVHAAITLAEEVLPDVAARSASPVRAVLVGPIEPSGPIARLASRPGVTVTGFVADLSPYYGSAELVVAPIEVGGGTRIKLLEAFAHGVPVVTTPAGAAGLAVRDGEQLLIADAVSSLSDAACRVLASPALAAKLSGSARDYVRRHHSPAVMQEAVAGFLAGATLSGGGHLL
jgi:glycosyltransferase involved in cell wall biosynthesis